MQKLIYILFLLYLIPQFSLSQNDSIAFPWPDDKVFAISLTFDDARPSQVNGGTALLDKYGAKATFYVVPSAVEGHLEGWKLAVKNGHEIANHSVRHPCTGNFQWSKDKALENYSLKQMKTELLSANEKIKKLLGVEMSSFAYPCGQTFVGRGKKTKSYIPVIAGLFTSGRGWLDEAPNDPAFCDMSQLLGYPMDGRDFEDLLPIIEQAKSQGGWLVLAGHEMGDSGNQTTRLSMLEKLIEYAQDPYNNVWLGTVKEVGDYVINKRKE